MKNILRVIQIIAFLSMIILYAIGYNRSGIITGIPFLIISIFMNEGSEYWKDGEL